MEITRREALKTVAAGLAGLAEIGCSNQAAQTEGTEPNLRTAVLNYARGLVADESRTNALLTLVATSEELQLEPLKNFLFDSLGSEKGLALLTALVVQRIVGGGVSFGMSESQLDQRLAYARTLLDLDKAEDWCRRMEDRPSECHRARDGQLKIWANELQLDEDCVKEVFSVGQLVGKARQPQSQDDTTAMMEQEVRERVFRHRRSHRRRRAGTQCFVLREGIYDPNILPI
jgi:hypothetical protein